MLEMGIYQGCNGMVDYFKKIRSQYVGNYTYLFMIGKKCMAMK